MKRLVLLAGVLALIGAACSSSDASVATVGGDDITRAEVESFASSDADEVPDAQFIAFLGAFIQWEAVEQAANEAFGFEATEAQIQARVDQLVEEALPGGTLEEFLTAIDLSEAGVRKYATQLVIRDEASSGRFEGFAVPTVADAELEIANDPLTWTEVCASHILVTTLVEADDVLARLADGESFAELATNLSLDPGSGANGGSLSCAPAARYVPAFAEATMTAEIGVVTAPVETEFGHHIILVESRRTAETADVLAALNAVAFDGWAFAMVEQSAVTVDEAVGRWVTDPSPQILAP